MLLLITTTGRPATDLGYLLHKNPARFQSFALTFGRAHVFYPEAGEDRCTAALLLEIDPIGLVRGRGAGGQTEGLLDQYVNDRPYVASSFLSVAMAQVFGTALSGRSRERPELASRPLPLTATLPSLPCRGGEAVLTRLFGPLGYEISTRRRPLDPNFPEWGESSYLEVELRTTATISDFLSHLYVLVPVLDDDKHYFVGDAEVEKLLRHGEGWLLSHPDKELIATRYLKHRRRLTREALARLVADDGADPDDTEETHAQEEAAIEKPHSLNEQRLGAVVAALKSVGAGSVLDLGCGEGKLLQALLSDKAFTKIVGLDVSHRALEIAKERLHLDRMPEAKRKRPTLLHGSLTYRDTRLQGFDAAAAVEVIEHLDPPRLDAFARVVFEVACPSAVVLTTPNAEHNALSPGLPAGAFRHRDHRFEWTRSQFEDFSRAAAARFGYEVRFASIGPDHPTLGAPTQMAVFTRRDETAPKTPPPVDA